MKNLLEIRISDVVLSAKKIVHRLCTPSAELEGLAQRCIGPTHDVKHEGCLFTLACTGKNLAACVRAGGCLSSSEGGVLPVSDLTY